MTNRPRIVADENIPNVVEALSGFADVERYPGNEIDRNRLSGADALLVRSVTRVDRELLAGTRISFVGAATIGTDHIDLDALACLGIAFAYAPGSNAESVVNYVTAALVHLAARERITLKGKVAGIIGCGNIGARLARQLPFFGLDVMKCDPFLAAEDPEGDYYDFEEVLRRADVVSFHVPLNHAGPLATHHMLGRDTFALLKPEAWILNTSRGAIVDNQALFSHLQRNPLCRSVLDVWENEPVPDTRLIGLSALATPHIAGYSLDGKTNGARTVIEALGRHFGIDVHVPEVHSPVRAASVPGRESFGSEIEWLNAVIRQVYDIAADDECFRRVLSIREAADRAALFTKLRKDYPERRDFSTVTIQGTGLNEQEKELLEHAVGFRVVGSP